MISSAAKATVEAPDLAVLVAQQQQLIQGLQQQIRLLQEKVNYLTQQRFGRKSEQLEAVGQGTLFDQPAVDSTPEVEPPLDDEAPLKARKPGGRRRPPPELPRLRIEHDLPEADQTCACGCQRQRIGEAVSEQYDVEPPRFRILQHVRYTYACPRCDQGIVTAPKAADPLPRAQVSPALLAWIGAGKYVDGLPLHRQARILSQRFGVDFTTATLSQWMIQSAEQLLKPLVAAMEPVLRRCDYLHMDETTLQVLDEPGRYAWQKSYLWVRASGSGPPMILLDYHASRAGAVADRLLDGFAGYLHVDGYSGYNGPAARDDIVVLGCWAHVRRKFDAALKASGRHSRQGVLAHAALTQIAQLYRIERAVRALADDQQLAERQRSRPLLDALRQWLDRHLDEAAALGGQLASACGYLHHQWPRLQVFLQDPRLQLDNNRVENHIRPIALGRKNWLFCQSPAGAHAAALWYSVVETAKANGWEPYHYLRWLFTELPARLQQGLSLEPLLPWVAAPQSGGMLGRG